MAVRQLTSPVLLALTCGIRALRTAQRWFPGWLALAASLHLVQALLPGAQVILINALLSKLSTGRPVQTDEFLPALGMLTLVVGAAFPLAQIAWQCSHRLGLRLNLRQRAQLADVAAAATPRRLADPVFVHDLESAQLATGSLGAVPQQTLQLITTVVTAVALCASIATISPAASLLVAAALLPTVVAFTFIARAELAGLPRLAAANRRSSYLLEQLLQQRTGTELATLQSGHKVARLAGQSRRDYFDVLDGLTRFGTRMELLCAAVTAAILGAALVTMVLAASTTAGAAAAIAGVISGIHAIRSSGNAFGQLVSAAPKAALFDAVVGSVPTALSAPGTPGTKHVRLANLRYTYPGSSRPALDDVSLEVRRGEMIALVGVNGAGKTTAINALLGIVDVDSGRVDIDGVDARHLSEQERLARFGLLTQEFGRYEFSCRDTVALGSSEDGISDDQLWQALAGARADNLVRQLPHGLDTQLGQQWGGVGLSGGQWQRIALARIHLRNAGVWILDEPTSAIDAEAERQVFAELHLVRSDHITIVVSHRAWTLRRMDQIHVFDGGRIVESGRFDELMAAGGRFAELFTDQVV